MIYVVGMVSTGRILLMMPAVAKALSPMGLYGSPWRKSLTDDVADEIWSCIFH